MVEEGGDYRCHHDGVRHIETEVVTHTKEFLTTMLFLKFITTSEKSRIIISLLFPCEDLWRNRISPRSGKM